MQHFEVGIIGGGLVGASLARLLNKNQIPSIVLDKQPAEALYSPTLDNRGLALAVTSANILQQIEVWPTLAAQAFAINTVHVSEQNSFGFSKIDAAKYNLPALGYVVSASALGAGLMRDLEQLPCVTSLRPASIEALYFDMQQQAWILTVGQQQIQTKLLVAADGSDSFLRAHQNIQIKTKDFQQSAIVTNIRTQLSCKQIAYERFTPQGVLALLPFGELQVKCVWTVENEYLAEFQQCSDKDFLHLVQQAIGFRLGKLLSVDARKIFPIQQVIAERINGECAILVGNAANTLHPVAAQGFNLGLRDAVCLADILATAKKQGLAINSVKTLAQYAAARQADHQQTLKYTCSLLDIFGSKNYGMRVARRFGLVAAQLIPQLNLRITQQGLGICES